MYIASTSRSPAVINLYDLDETRAFFAASAHTESKYYQTNKEATLKQEARFDAAHVIIENGVWSKFKTTRLRIPSTSRTRFYTKLLQRNESVEANAQILQSPNTLQQTLLLQTSLRLLSVDDFIRQYPRVNLKEWRCLAAFGIEGPLPEDGEYPRKLHHILSVADSGQSSDCSPYIPTDLDFLQAFAACSPAALVELFEAIPDKRSLPTLATCFLFLNVCPIARFKHSPEQIQGLLDSLEWYHTQGAKVDMLALAYYFCRADASARVLYWLYEHMEDTERAKFFSKGPVLNRPSSGQEDVEMLDVMMRYWRKWCFCALSVPFRCVRISSLLSIRFLFTIAAKDIVENRSSNAPWVFGQVINIAEQQTEFFTQGPEVSDLSEKECAECQRRAAAFVERVTGVDSNGMTKDSPVLQAKDASIAVYEFYSPPLMNTEKSYGFAGNRTPVSLVDENGFLYSDQQTPRLKVVAAEKKQEREEDERDKDFDSAIVADEWRELCVMSANRDTRQASAVLELLCRDFKRRAESNGTETALDLQLYPGSVFRDPFALCSFAQETMQTCKSILPVEQADAFDDLFSRSRFLDWIFTEKISLEQVMDDGTRCALCALFLDTYPGLAHAVTNAMCTIHAFDTLSGEFVAHCSSGTSSSLSPMICHANAVDPDSIDKAKALTEPAGKIVASKRSCIIL